MLIRSGAGPKWLSGASATANACQREELLLLAHIATIVSRVVGSEPAFILQLEKSCSDPAGINAPWLRTIKAQRIEEGTALRWLVHALRRTGKAGGRLGNAR